MEFSFRDVYYSIPTLFEEADCCRECAQGSGTWPACSMGSTPPSSLPPSRQAAKPFFLSGNACTYHALIVCHREKLWPAPWVACLLLPSLQTDRQTAKPFFLSGNACTYHALIVCHREKLWPAPWVACLLPPSLPPDRLPSPSSYQETLARIMP